MLFFGKWPDMASTRLSAALTRACAGVIVGMGALSQADVHLVASVVLPRISYVVSACCVGGPCLMYIWHDMGFHLATKWWERICIVIMLPPKICVCWCDCGLLEHVEGVIHLG